MLYPAELRGQQTPYAFLAAGPPVWLSRLQPQSLNCRPAEGAPRASARERHTDPPAGAVAPPAGATPRVSLAGPGSARSWVGFVCLRFRPGLKERACDSPAEDASALKRPHRCSQAARLARDFESFSTASACLMFSTAASSRAIRSRADSYSWRSE